MDAWPKGYSAISTTGLIWVCKLGNKPKMILKSGLTAYLEEGWQRGRKVR